MGGVRDGYSNFRFFEALAPQSFSGTAVTGATVDRRGLNAGENYETVTFIVHAGEISGVASAAQSVQSCGWMRMQHGTSNAAGTVVWSNCSAEHILTDIRRHGDDTVLGAAGGSTTATLGSNSYGLLAVSNAGSGLAAGTFFCLGGVSADNQSWWESKAIAAGYVGDHRWVRLIVSASAAGEVSALGIAAIAVLGLPGAWPVNTVRRTDE
jgi:hypothetical protein